MARKNMNKASSGSATTVPQNQLTDMIRKKAYELYEKRGKKQGRDMDNWLEAERIVKQKTF